MIRPFDFYLQEGLARKTNPNPGLARSFIVKSEIRLKRIMSQPVTGDEASIIFEDIYEVLREASQALMEIHGYKPYSHEALISFLQQNIFLSRAQTETLNSYRILRNNSVYLAESISPDKCKEAILFAQRTLPDIKKQFEKLLTA